MTETESTSKAPAPAPAAPQRSGKFRWVRTPAEWYNGILELTPYLPDDQLGKPTRYEVELLGDAGWNVYPLGKPTSPYTCYRVRRTHRPTEVTCNCPDALNRGVPCKHVEGLRAALRKLANQQTGEY